MWRREGLPGCPFELSEQELYRVFDSPQSFQRGFLRFSQPLHTANIHPFIRPIGVQCLQAGSRLGILDNDSAVIITAGQQAPIEAKGHRPHLDILFSEGLEILRAALLLDVPERDAMIIIARCQ
jgi:hypothetical protein